MCKTFKYAVNTCKDFMALPGNKVQYYMNKYKWNPEDR